jgi:hypothetical protein
VYAVVGNVTGTENILKRILATLVIEIIVRKALLDIVVVKLNLQVDRTELFKLILKESEVSKGPTVAQ